MINLSLAKLNTAGFRLFFWFGKNGLEPLSNAQKSSPKVTGMEFVSRFLRSLVVFGFVAGLAGDSFGDESLKGIACRSVHLAYTTVESTAFCLDVTVDSSASGSYFMVCGWDAGYFGLQELGNNKKLVLFSVWDPHEQDDPNSVPEEKRVKTVYKDEQVRVGRFGGEGTGGQSFFDYDWKVGETYRFLVQAKKVGDRSEYSGHFFVPETIGDSPI